MSEMRAVFCSAHQNHTQYLIKETLLAPPTSRGPVWSLFNFKTAIIWNRRTSFMCPKLFRSLSEGTAQVSPDTELLCSLSSGLVCMYEKHKAWEATAVIWWDGQRGMWLEIGSEGMLLKTCKTDVYSDLSTMPLDSFFT